MIKIDDLRVQFGKFVAVDGLNLQTEPGQIFGFLGPNGAGKTTTVRVLTGVLRPTSGTVTIAGHSIPADLHKVKELCGYVPDTEDHYDELSGRENLRIYASLYRIPKQRVDEVLARLELSEAANLAVARYSKGMRKKLLIAPRFCIAPKFSSATNQPPTWTHTLPVWFAISWVSYAKTAPPFFLPRTI